MLEVRRATPDDVEAISQVYIVSWRAAYDGPLPEPVLSEQAELRRAYDWRHFIDSDRDGVFVAVDDNVIVGVAQSEETIDEVRDLPELGMLYVLPEAWGTPAATLLLAAATSWISDRGHRHARLRVVEDQLRARRFYEREGWHLDTLEPAWNGFRRLIYYRRSLET